MTKLIILIAVVLLAVVVASCIPHPFTSPEKDTEPTVENQIQTPTTPEPPSSVVEPPPESTRIIRQIPETTRLITHQYAWSFAGKEWTMELQIPEALYDYYRSLPRPPTRNYSVYVTHPSDDEYIRSLTDEIEQIARQERFSDLQKAEFVIAFVQHLPYTVDSVTTPYDEYPRYPVETLVDYGGDCEDTSILLASLLNSLSYEVVLIIFPETSAMVGHIGVGILYSEGIVGAYFEVDGQRYYYIETTNPGWRIGNIPDAYKKINANIYTMTPAPILTHNWEASITKRFVNSKVLEYTVQLNVTVENLGSAPAENIHILAGFDTGTGKIWNPVESQVFDLLIGQGATITLTLQAPLGKHTRLVIQVIDNNYAADQSYSDWFDT